MPLKRIESAYNFIHKELANVHWNEDNLQTRILHTLAGYLLGYGTFRFATFVSMFLGLLLLTLEVLRTVCAVPINWVTIWDKISMVFSAIQSGSSLFHWNFLKCRGLVSGFMLGASVQGVPFWSLVLLVIRYFFKDL